MQACMPAIILIAVGVAALGSWGLSGTVTSNQTHEAGKILGLPFHRHCLEWTAIIW